MGFSLDLRYEICLQPIELPVFNPVALELVQLLADHDVEFDEVISTINKDPALSIQILRMANSSAYAGRYKSETIKDSVNRLGARQITSLAMAASQAALHTSPIPIVNTVMQGLWMHSHACALGCRSLAVSTGHHELADQAYLAGLLHDIGKLYLLKAMEQINLKNQNSLDLDQETLLDVFSYMHVEQGFRIMDHWRIPDRYSSIVARHHDDEADLDDPLLCLVRLVNFTSIQKGLSPYPQFIQPLNADAEIRALAASDKDLDMMVTAMNGSCS